MPAAGQIRRCKSPRDIRLPRRSAWTSSQGSLPLRHTLLAGTSALALAWASPQMVVARPLGGGAQVSATTVAADTAALVAQQAAAIAKQSQNALTRATQAIQAMQAVQNAARHAAISGPNSLGAGLPAVTDGLSAGGLIPDSGLSVSGQSNPVITWIGAGTPAQSASNGQTTVTVTQNAPYALLNWQQFNIGKNTTLTFDQGGNTTWVALNKINGPAGVPSQILGSIKAAGAVYLINQSGIIFGGSSQINVQTLIASSLNLNDTYATDSSTSNFLAGKGILSAGASPSFQSVDSNGNPYSAGAVTVQAGAQLNATGGDVLLLAPTVINNGAINTPSGQALLVGGSDVLLATGDSYTRGFVVLPNPNPLAADTSIYRPASVGTQVPSFYASTIPGTVINNGAISAPQGNITITAGTVSQNGVLTATTSTTANGSINIQAQAGTLTLGGVGDNPLYSQYGVSPQQSLIQIIPDPTDLTPVTDTQAIANSSIALSGANVDIRGIVQLHGYDVTNPSDHPGGISIVATGSGANSSGQVYLESGSLLDGSGTTDAVASASRNSVAVELRSNELRDSPLVKAGPLYQQTIYVDASASGTNADGSTWQGTPLADASAWIALTGRSLEERMMNGAPITISGATVAYDSSSGTNQAAMLPAELVQAPGSIINIAGGYLTYAAGFVQVSTLITADGRLVSAGNADPNVQYIGVCCSFTVNHDPARYGVGASETYTSPLRSSGYEQPSYIQGGAGGSLNLEVQAAVLDGQLYAGVVSGEKQRTAATAPGATSLSVNGTNLATWLSLIYGTAYDTDNIFLSDAAATTATGWVLGFDIHASDLDSIIAAKQPGDVSANSVYLPASWLNSGLGSVSLAANSNIVLPAGNPITLPAFGSFSASAGNVDVESAITAPSGIIALSAVFTASSTSNVNLTTAAGGNPNGTVSATSGLVSIGAGVALSAAGAWTNDADGPAVGAIAANGNTISISSTNDIDIGLGSMLDVSGGGYESPAGKITAGNGGTITLAAASPLIPSPTLPLGTTLPVQAPLGSVNFAGGLQPGQFKGYGTIGSSSVGSGGTLDLTSVAAISNGSTDPVVAAITPAADMGGALLSNGAPALDVAGNSFLELNISTAFFSSGGFATVGVTAAGIGLKAGVVLNPTVETLAIGIRSAPSAATLAGLATPLMLASGLRPASSTTLHAIGDVWRSEAFGSTPSTSVATSVDLTFGLDIGGTIQTDPKGSVTLIGDQAAVVSGIVDAPGGSITLGGGTYNNSANAAGGSLPVALNGEGVWLTGQLLATGTEIAVPQSNRTTYQDVLPGGQVSVSGGDIFLVPGSTIDVSGTSGLSTLAAAGSGFSSVALLGPTAPSTVDSAGGTISISAILGGVLEGNLLGSGGGSAAGATLNLALAAHGVNSNGKVAGFWPNTEYSYITLQQSLQPGAPNYFAAALLEPGTNPGAKPINDANLTVSADMVGQGGFASLALSAPGTYGAVTFSGNTRLTLPNQLVIGTATILVPNGATETLSANYVQWNNPVAGGYGQPGVGTGSLTINANTVDLVGNIAVQGAATTTFNVAGDLRLTATLFSSDYSGSLLSAQDLIFNAGQVYPSTATTFTLASATMITFGASGAPPPAPLSAGGVLNVDAPVIEQGGTVRAPTGTINLGYSGQTSTATSPGNVSLQNGDPSMIAFATSAGYLKSDGTTIPGTFLTSSGILNFQLGGTTSLIPGENVTISSQGIVVTGIVTAASTSSVLQIDATSLSVGGTAKTSLVFVDNGQTPANWAISAAGSNLTLKRGSLTSVSAGGQTVLYGYVQNGTWYASTQLDTSLNGVALSAPPAKQIGLSGSSIFVAPGATIDASGGGDLYAGEFVPGTGGSQSIFLGANKYLAANANVYAVIPGYTGIAPYDPGISTSGPSLGSQVYLSGVPGLAAGTYALLPGSYAQLPGAFLVTVQASPGAATVAATRAPIATTALPDGSYRASGYVVTPGTGATAEHWSVFTVMSDAVARKYSQITDNYANTFFTALAATNGTAVPRLPQDAGQLMIAATGSISFQGQGVFDHPNGLGGLADISANQILVLDSGNSAAVATYVPGSLQVGGDGSDFVAHSSTSSTAVTIATGAQTFTTATNLPILAGQSVTATDRTNAANSMTGTVVSYDPATGVLMINVTAAKGAGTPTSWAIAAVEVWNPIVLAAGDLDRLGVESLLLGGTRSFSAAGVNFTGSASQVVIANSANDPLALPDIQLIASPERQSVTYVAGGGTQLSLVQGIAGTGQVIVAPGAVIQSRGAVSPGAEPTFILAAPPVLPQPDINGIYSASDIQQYYQAVVANEIAYVRVSGDSLAKTVGGNATYAGLPASPLVRVDGANATFDLLPLPNTVGSVSVGGAELSASNSLTLFGNARIAAGAAISAQAAELKSSLISLGTDDFSSLSGMVLDQAALDSLAGVKALTLVSTSTVDLYGTLTLGGVDASRQPLLGSLVLDSAGVVAEPAGGAGTATFIAEQVTLQNTLGGTVTQINLDGTVTSTPKQVNGTELDIIASDVRETDPSGTATGYNNATISFGAGAVALAGFANVDLKSSGQIAATGDGGSLNVQSALTLDAPRITAGSLGVVNGLPQFNVVSYTITAADNPATSSPVYYPVDLINSSGVPPALPTALLGNSLTINSAATTLSTAVVLPGGVFNLTAQGNITVANGGTVDVSGQAIQFVDASASIGGGNINLTSVSGAIAIAAGASLNVGDVAGVGSLNPTSAGTLSLAAPTGGVTIATGALSGVGPGPDNSGSFVLDTRSLDVSTSPTSVGLSYDSLASMLLAGGFGKSWNIRARAGNITMSGLTQAQSVTVSTDSGSIDVSGTIDASGATGGQINLYAGTDLILESSAVLNAHGTVADANGRGGQVWLAAAQAWDGTAPTTSGIVLNVGARTDVGVDALNGGVSAPVFGGSTVLTVANNAYGAVSTTSLNLAPVVGAGTSYTSITQPGLGLGKGQFVTFTDSTGNSISGTVTSYDNTTGAIGINVTGENVPAIGGIVTFSTARNASGVNLAVNGGSFADFVRGIAGESAWDGVVVVGNQVYSYNDTTLYLTPTTAVAPSGGVQTVAFTTYLSDAANFMSNQSAIWASLGADGNGIANGTYISAGAFYTSGVLVNIRPGIAIKNSGGDITVEGDPAPTGIQGSNPNGIDLSGSSYIGSVLNTGESQTLNGHFGQYDEPVVLAIRAAGNLNFGVCSGLCSSVNGSPRLGSLSDGFSQYYNNGTSIVSLYPSVNSNWDSTTGITGAGASGAATLFDPAAAGAYHYLSGGLGADSATYFLTAGADTKAANPLAVITTATGTLTVAGVPGTSTLSGASGGSAAADPLYVYNDDTNGYSSGTAVTLAEFVDYASLVRTGTGNIDIATGKDLVLQSPLSLIYSAGTGYNVDNTSAQPLAGFTQYSGMLSIIGNTKSGVVNEDTLPASTFPTHGGDVTLAIGGNIVGAMNRTHTVGGYGTDQELPYDMTALGSQLKLQNWCVGTNCSSGESYNFQGQLSALYATDAWMKTLTATTTSVMPIYTYYTLNGLIGTAAAPATNAPTPGDYQLAWYTWFPFLENTIGSFGGGNIAVKAGGSISLVQFVAPTNARDAGPALVATSYNSAAQTGLYTQGGGNISVTAGGNISGVYTYAQNGATSLKAGGSVGNLDAFNAVTDQVGEIVTIPLLIETSTGDVSVQAGRSIDIADQEVSPTAFNNNGTAATLSSLSLIQNADFLAQLDSNIPANKIKSYPREITLLTGILTSVPTGSVTLQAVGDITLQVAGGSEGLLPPQLNLVSLQGDITNSASFVTYPAASGTVNLLARGSVTLNAGFVLSDASLSVTPTLANIVAAFASPNLDTTVTSQNVSTTTMSLNNLPLVGPLLSVVLEADAQAGLPAPASVADLAGDAPVQLIVDLPATDNPNTNPYGIAALTIPITPQTEAARHAGLHAGQSDLARIIALNGDVTQGGLAQGTTTIYNFGTSYEDITTATEVYAGRDVRNLALLGQNNNPTDVTSIIAGRDVFYQTQSTQASIGGLAPIAFAVEIGGPGNLLIQSGRNTDLGNSAGFQSFGDLLNPRLANAGPGAGITVETGLGSGLMLDDASFVAQYVDPATDGTNPFAEPLQLFNAPQGGAADAYDYFKGLSAANQNILLNKVFFGLLRDAGREHTGVTGDTNYELGAATLDTVAAFNAAYANYQRAFAAVAAYVPNTTLTGNFLGGLSTVRTQAGGDITILAPHGQIEVGLATPPAGFPGYSNPTDPTYALGFGVVTERGGNVDLYADGDISVNQSRVFTLEGGDLNVISLNGNIDAGKGAKTVQAIQPPSVSYDAYGDITITPYGPSSGSGLAVLRALPGVPLSNADLIAMNGFVDAGDAGIRSSGNLNIAALAVLNAGNIQVGGKATGVPTVEAPNIGGLTAANNTAGAGAKTDAPTGSTGNNDRPSIIIVEVLGYGGSGDDSPTPDPDAQKRRGKDDRSYDTNSPFQVVGAGALNQAADRYLTEAEKKALQR